MAKIFNWLKSADNDSEHFYDRAEDFLKDNTQKWSRERGKVGERERKTVRDDFDRREHCVFSP